MIRKLYKRKYVIIGTAFVVWMLFFDRNSFIEQYKQYREVKELQQASNYFKEQIEISKQERDELFSDTANLEKFAREKYLMKRDNEDVFVIIKEED